MVYGLKKMNDHLIKFLESLKTDVINSMHANGRMASGQTANDILIIKDGEKLSLELPGYVMALENGRRPTGKNAQQGNPPMIQRIQQWCQAKGISEKFAWA